MHPVTVSNLPLAEQIAEYERRLAHWTTLNETMTANVIATRRRLVPVIEKLNTLQADLEAYEAKNREAASMIQVCASRLARMKQEQLK